MCSSSWCGTHDRDCQAGSHAAGRARRRVPGGLARDSEPGPQRPARHGVRSHGHGHAGGPRVSARRKVQLRVHVGGSSCPSGGHGVRRRGTVTGATEEQCIRRIAFVYLKSRSHSPQAELLLVNLARGIGREHRVEIQIQGQPPELSWQIGKRSCDFITLESTSCDSRYQVFSFTPRAWEPAK